MKSNQITFQYLVIDTNLEMALTDEYLARMGVWEQTWVETQVLSSHLTSRIATRQTLVPHTATPYLSQPGPTTIPRVNTTSWHHDTSFLQISYFGNFGMWCCLLRNPDDPFITLVNTVP